MLGIFSYFLKIFTVKYNKYIDKFTKQKCTAQLTITKPTLVKGMEHMYKATLTSTFYLPEQQCSWI